MENFEGNFTRYPCNNPNFIRIKSSFSVLDTEINNYSHLAPSGKLDSEIRIESSLVKTFVPAAPNFIEAPGTYFLSAKASKQVFISFTGHQVLLNHRKLQ